MVSAGAVVEMVMVVVEREGGGSCGGSCGDVSTCGK